MVPPPTIQQRFLRAPLLFITALHDGPSALDTFAAEWDQLGVDLEQSLISSSVNAEELLVAQAASLQIASLSNTYSDIQHTTSSMMSSFVTEIGNALSKVSISDRSSHRQTSPPISSRPSYNPKAFSWILDNLDDPYPTLDEKREISSSSRCSLRVISEWFKSTRRYIGWTDVCKRHFSGSRASARNAARQIFVLQQTDGLSEAIVADFLAVKSNLHSLYVEEQDDDAYSEIPFTPSPTYYHHGSSLPPTPRSTSYSRPLSSLSQHSTTPSLLSSTSEESEDSDPLSEVPIDFLAFQPYSSSPNAGKHHHAFTHTFFSNESYDADVVHGRRLTLTTNSEVDTSSSVYVVDESASPSGTQEDQPPSPYLQTKRKRRLSDVGMEVKRKRPLVSLATRAVSDPFPCNSTTTFDVDQFIHELKDVVASIFEIPPAVTTETSTLSPLRYQEWDNINVNQSNESSKSCDRWNPLVSDNSIPSPHATSDTPVNIPDITSELSFDDLWISLFDAPEPLAETEAVSVAPPRIFPTVEFNSFPTWDADVSSLDGFVDLLNLPPEESPSVL